MAEDEDFVAVSSEDGHSWLLPSVDDAQGLCESQEELATSGEIPLTPEDAEEDTPPWLVEAEQNLNSPGERRDQSTSIAAPSRTTSEFIEGSDTEEKIDETEVPEALEATRLEGAATTWSLSASPTWARCQDAASRTVRTVASASKHVSPSSLAQLVLVVTIILVTRYALVELHALSANAATTYAAVKDAVAHSDAAQAMQVTSLQRELQHCRADLDAREQRLGSLEEGLATKASASLEEARLTHAAKAQAVQRLAEAEEELTQMRKQLATSQSARAESDADLAGARAELGEKRDLLLSLESDLMEARVKLQKEESARAEREHTWREAPSVYAEQRQAAQHQQRALEESKKLRTFLRQKQGELMKAEMAAAAATRSAASNEKARREERLSWKWRVQELARAGAEHEKTIEQQQSQLKRKRQELEEQQSKLDAAHRKIAALKAGDDTDAGHSGDRPRTRQSHDKRRQEQANAWRQRCNYNFADSFLPWDSWRTWATGWPRAACSAASWHAWPFM